MNYFSVVDLEKFQHYKDRMPPWFKVHARGDFSVFDWYEFTCLQDASKLHLILIWGLATKMNNRIPYDPEWVKTHLKVKSKVDLKALLDKGFIALDSELLASCNQSATPETYKEEAYTKEAETETKLSGDGDLPHRVIAYLNLKAKRKFSLTSKHYNLIKTRIKEGACEEDFKVVVDKMVDKWGKDGKMMEFLRPITLFSPKFDSYLNMPSGATGEKPSTFEHKRSVVDEWAEESKSNDSRSIQVGAKDNPKLRGSEPGQGNP